MKKLLPLALLLAMACAPELVCPEGETDCDGRCVSLFTDPANCGACGVAVGPLGSCVDGGALCAAGIAVCEGACTDLARDAANCGACGAACEANQFCTTDGEGTSCTSACPTGFTPCDRACVDLLADPYHCGACGASCPSGQVCQAGACRPDVVVACYATTEVVPVSAALAPAGDPWPTPSGPTFLAADGSAVYAANGYPQASVSVLPFDALPAVHLPVSGDDLEEIGLVDGVVVASNASVGTLLFVSTSGTLLGEVALPDNQSLPNPHGFAVVGDTAYVALYGSGGGAGQSIARVSLSLAACAADPLQTPCGAVLGEIDLLAVPAAFDAPGRPFPSGALAAGGKVYVTLANLKEADFTSYTAWSEPAGHGKLAVIDPADGDALTVIDLGAGCGNPGSLAVEGSTLWVACGSWSFPVAAPGVLVPVDLSQDPPVVGTPLSMGAALPGGLAFCGGLGYATDQASGAVVRFDPVARTAEAPVTICPTGPWGFAWAADVACGR